MSSLQDQAVELHRHLRGKIEMRPTYSIERLEDLSLIYTPGVGAAFRARRTSRRSRYAYVEKMPSSSFLTDPPCLVWEYRSGGRVAGYGRKCDLQTVRQCQCDPHLFLGRRMRTKLSVSRSPSPRVSERFSSKIFLRRVVLKLERRVQDALDIPVMHDDQHGTAIRRIGRIDQCDERGR